MADNVTRPCPTCSRPVPIDATRCATCWAKFSAGSMPYVSVGQNATLPRANSGHTALPSGVNRGNPMNRRTVISIGIVIAVIGVALIIISPSLLFVEPGPPSRFDPWGLGNQKITDLRNVAMFFGVALLIVGGIISAVGFNQFTSIQPTTPPAPTAQPVVTQSVSPKSVELGNTPDEVQSVMGQPDKIINLGARVIHVYKDMKIIYVDGKVSDVQLS
jgi:hypothetical protein